MVETKILNPLDAIRNIWDLPDKHMVTHIKRVDDVNERYDYKVVRAATHDGTFLFTELLLEEVLTNLVMKKSFCAAHDTDGVVDVRYEIGDIVLETTYESISCRQVAVLPVRSYPLKEKMRK